MPHPLVIFSQSYYLIQALDTNSQTYGKECRSRSVGFLRSQLIWIYTLCKGRVYPGSAGLGLRVLYWYKAPTDPHPSPDWLFQGSSSVAVFLCASRFRMWCLFCHYVPHLSFFSLEKTVFHDCGISLGIFTSIFVFKQNSLIQNEH